MSHDYPSETCGLIPYRIYRSSQSKGSQAREDKYDSTGMCKQQGSSTQIEGVKIYSAENRPCYRDGDPNQDMCSRNQNRIGKSSPISRQYRQRNILSIGMRRSLSRQYIRRSSISTPPTHSFQLTLGNSHCEIESKVGCGGHPSNRNSSKISKRFRSPALTLLHSGSIVESNQIIKGISGSFRHPLCDLVREPTVVESLSRSHISNQGNRHSHQTKQENTANIQSKENMERPEDCFHCRDLNMEFNELRSQQRALEDLVRSMENQLEDKIRILENRMEEQVKILHNKYRAEMDLFLHRVHSLHEQYSALHNRCIHAEEKCIHAEEKIDALKKMLEKKEASSSSSDKPIEVDMDPDGSTARKMSHIEID